jgi:hypothetical protein
MSFYAGACNAANISVTWSAPWSKLAMEISATCGDNLVFNAKGKVDVIQLKIRKSGPLCSVLLFLDAVANV